MTEYVVFKRKNTNPTILPKQSQSSKEAWFFVRKTIAHKFPSRGISWKAMHMADIIMVNGVMIKNVFGPITLQSPASLGNQG